MSDVIVDQAVKLGFSFITWGESGVWACPGPFLHGGRPRDMIEFREIGKAPILPLLDA